MAIDQRGIPSSECLNCGDNIQVIRAIFDEGDLVDWFSDSFCASCGSPMTAPHPLQDEETDDEFN